MSSSTSINSSLSSRCKENVRSLLRKIHMARSRAQSQAPTATPIATTSTDITSTPESTSLPPLTPIASHLSDTPLRDSKKKRSSNDVRNSLYRPKVASAKDRLKFWTSPHAIRHREQLLKTVSEEEANKLFEVMIASLDDTTRSTYSAGLLRFSQFCDKNNVPEEFRMPASENLLATFVSSHAGSVSDSTVNNWLAGLHFWHNIHGAPWHGGDMLTQTRKGIKKMVPISSRRAKRPPVTVEHMSILHKGLDLTNCADIAVWAIASISFWSCCRLGELTIPSPSTFDPKKHVLRNTEIQWSQTGGSSRHAANRFVSVRIPWSKTTGFSGADISITARPDDPLCPLLALERHLQANAQLPPHAPLFSYTDNIGSLQILPKKIFLKRCNEIWTEAGMPEMPGHSFRIGGATHLLLLGTPPEVVAMQGRWRSNAFLEYWRQIESILPIFLTAHNSGDTIQSISTKMKTYKKHCKK